MLCIFHEAENGEAHPVLTRQYHCSAYRTSHQEKTNTLEYKIEELVWSLLQLPKFCLIFLWT